MRALLKFAADTYSSELPLTPATSADDDVPVGSDNSWHAFVYLILGIVVPVLFWVVVHICCPRRGLKESALKALPKTRYKKAAGIENQPECVICLTEFEEEVWIRKLPQCGHEFHVECIDKWLLSRASCPSCRAEVVVQSPQSQEAG